jgi:hypothetical protein
MYAARNLIHAARSADISGLAEAGSGPAEARSGPWRIGRVNQPALIASATLPAARAKPLTWSARMWGGRVKAVPGF